MQTNQEREEENMPQTRDRGIMRWLFIFAAFVALLVLWGGFTRLTRSGLSIVEWNPISGALPPLGEQAWQQEFIKYQQTPEYILVNHNMKLGQYKLIFFIEWFHRLLARSAGLLYAIPVFYFLARKRIPWKQFGIYFGMGMLFIAQAFAGWYMVASGLKDVPAVSHYMLTLHLSLALTLLGSSLWTGFSHRYGFPTKAAWSTASKWGAAAFLVLIIQILYGALTAGLKAGHISNTWPLMFGRLIPGNLFQSASNLVEAPHTIMFIHRWFAWLGLIAVPLVYLEARKRNFAPEIVKGLTWLTGFVVLQITLGILVVLYEVNMLAALMHQANAIGLFVMAVFFMHQLRLKDGKQITSTTT
jgi:cytochrome c oxidase assembly protein subunit 15